MAIFSSINCPILSNFFFCRRQESKCQKKTTFSDSIYQVYITARCYGLLPFSFTYKNGVVVAARVGTLDILLFITSLAFYMALIYLTPYRNKWISSISPILVHEHYIQLIIGLVRTILSIVLDMCNRKRIARIIVDVNTFDEQVIFFPIFKINWNFKSCLL